MTLSRGLSLLAACALSSGLVLACVVDSTDYRSASGGGGGGSAGTPSPTPTGSTSTNPILVDVDTDATMNAKGGDGVGIYTEYSAGGHWHVWWTCDTNKTGSSCNMDIAITVDSGAISNTTASANIAANGINATAQKLEVTSTTTTSVDGVRFDTPAGAIITVDATINDPNLGKVRDPSFFFFVQNGQVNGGFMGKLTDPLRFEGSKP